MTDMSDTMKASLKHLIVGHEGYDNFPYHDTLGNITIGIGYNLTARGLSDSWINNQFEEDTAFFYNQLARDFKWFAALDDARKCALIDMCFMGYKRFLGFDKMLKALGEGDFSIASQEIIRSEWALQVKKRATEISNILLTGAI